MSSAADAITKTIPISQFNRGLAGKIFSDVKKNGAKVVMKNNTAEVVLVSPDEYLEMMDDLNDYRQLARNRQLSMDKASGKSGRTLFHSPKASMVNLSDINWAAIRPDS